LYSAVVAALFSFGAGMTPVATANDKEETYDIVIYGGTSGGVAAAVQASRMGKSVVLIEPSKHIGGLTSGGLGATDIGNKGAIGGIAREFYQRIKKYYDDESAWKYEKAADYRSRRQGAGEDTQWTFEPHVAEKVFREMLKEAKVEILTGERLQPKRGLMFRVRQTIDEKALHDLGIAVDHITMESGRKFRGQVFIDATYEGDLMARAKVSSTIGREANSQYKETLNGVQTRNATHHQFIKPVDPFRTPGDPKSGVLPGIHDGSPGEEGAADKRVQAYNFRLCATDVPENRRPWPKPDGYDPLRYELLLRNFEAGDHRIPWNPILMPNRKTDSNNNFAVSTDNIGMNYDYPDGDYATRERIHREHESYQKGLMWTLANSPRVPEKVRQHFETWGLAKDEFTDNDNWPHQLYIREARRMVGAYVMTQHNCQGRETVKDPIGLAAYTMDSHNVQRYVKDGRAINEGDVQVGGFPPYPIAYRSITPKENECENLLVPVCLSASHIAYGSIRMEPVFMVLGQSAATAAAHAIDEKTSVQRIDFDKLQKRLLADKQVLAWTGKAGGTTYAVDLKKLSGVIVDDGQAELTGDWVASSSIAGYVGTAYRHDNNTDQGKKSAKFTPDLPAAGKYEVRCWFTPNDNRAPAVAITIMSADGDKTVMVNQRTRPTNWPGYVSLGQFEFAAGRSGSVTISNAGAKGFVIIDAVQFVPVTK
jgi:hypothetical protein